MFLSINKNEKRTRFDALPSPEVSSAEVRSIPATGGGYASRLADWLQSKGVIGSYINEDIRMDNIVFNKSSIKSVKNHNAGIGKLALLEVVPNLIKNGIFLETNPKNDEGLVSHIFAAKTTIDGEEYAISYIVREDKNGRRYYDHSLTKREALDRIDDQAPNNFTDGESTGIPLATTGPSAKPAGEEPTTKILKKHLCVNTQQ